MRNNPSEKIVANPRPVSSLVMRSLVPFAFAVKTVLILTAGCGDHRARRYIARGRHDLALESIKRSTRRNPYLEAKALAGLERYEEAYEAALEEVSRQRRRSRGPGAPFLLAARLAHRLDYAHECLELLDAARERVPIPPEDKIMEARRRLDRALHLLNMGGSARPADDVARAIHLLSSANTRSAGREKPSSSGESGKIAGFEELPSLAFRAWTTAAAWAFAHNDKDKAEKYLSKPSNPREKRLVAGPPPAEMIPLRRSLKALLENRSPSSPLDTLAITRLFSKTGAFEALVKTIQKIDHSAASGENLRLLELGLKGARKTWNQKASWEFQTKLGKFASASSAGLRERVIKAAAAECRYWENPLAPSCKTIEHLAVMSAKDDLLRQWIDILLRMAGKDKPFGHTKGFAERLHRADPTIRHDAIKLLLHLKSPPVELKSFLQTKTARAEILRLKGDVSGSVNLLDRVLEKNRWDGATRLELGFFALKYGDPESALAHLRWAQNLIRQEPKKHKHLIEISNRLFFTALRLERGPAGVFHHLEEDALTWIHSPMSIAEFEERINSGLSEITGPGHWPLGLVWLERLQEALLNKPSYFPEKDPEKEDEKPINTQLKSALLKSSAEPLEAALQKWMSLLFLKKGQPTEQSPLIARWFAWLPSDEHRKILGDRIESAMQHAPKDEIPKHANADPVLSAGLACIRLEYYQAAKKLEKKRKTTGLSKTRIRELKKGMKTAVKEGAKLAKQLKPLSEKELRSSTCSFGPDSPTIWKARLLVLTQNPDKAKNLLISAVRTGPQGSGLCRFSSILAHLLDLDLDVEKIAHQIASAFKNEPVLLAPAAKALAWTDNEGWTEMADRDLPASSPDGSRVFLELAENHLDAGNCDRAGKAATNLFQWTSPLLPEHAPAVKLTARVFAHCNRMDRLHAQIEGWRKTRIKRAHPHVRECFSRTTDLVAKALIRDGLRDKVEKITAVFGDHQNALEKATNDLRQAPLDPEAVCTLARGFMNRDIADQAFGLIQRNMALAPEALCSHLIAAEFAVKHRSWGDAEDLLAWLIAAKGPSDFAINALTDLVQLYLDLGHPEHALGLLKKTILDPSRTAKDSFSSLESARRKAGLPGGRFNRH